MRPAAHVANSPKLTLAQNCVEARLKIFFSFAPQLISFHRQCPFNGLDPTEQWLDVFARLCGIFAPVGLYGHPLPESSLDGVIGTVKWIRRRSGRQNSLVPSEQMLESQ